MRKKVPIVGVFSLGLFTILAAILNKVYSFSDPFGAEWTYWYVRESSTALLVANLPFVWTFWRRVSGTRSVNGVSGQASRDVKGTLNEAARKRFGSDDSVEMQNAYLRKGSAGSGGMTLAEMLGGETLRDADDVEPNPYTHPQLYYARKKASMSKGGQPGISSAVTADTPFKDTLRRESSSSERQGGTPTSSIIPSLAKKRSTGSLV